MPMTFDATLKDKGRDSPLGVLTTFDRPPTLPVKLLSVDLSTVTSATDLLLGLGDPLEEIVHVEFQSSAAGRKHADLLVYNALAFAHYQVPVHTVIILLRPAAQHSNLSGTVAYAPRPGRGRMEFGYEIVRLWERPAGDLLAGDIGLTPLAVLGRLPAELSLEDALTAVAQRLVDRLTKEAPPDRAKKLLTEALLLTGLRIRREAAARGFRGVRAMQESDTYLMILEEGEEKATRKHILMFGEDRIGPASEEVRTHLSGITDRDRLERILRRTLTAVSWQQLLETA
jgi:hypothetical protein